MASNYNGKTVLVTGAAGFIGSHLTAALVKEGARVRALVHYNSESQIGHLASLPDDVQRQVDIVLGNVEDPSSVEQVARDCEIIFHLAALIAIPYSYVAPRSYVATNVSGTVNVLEACRRLGAVRMVHTSTSECYGTALRVPIDEDHPLHGQSPYSATKIAADKLAESYWRSFDTPVVTVRPFNTYGPRQSARAFIPTIISQALTEPFIRLGALDPVRDLTYVTDTTAGFLAAGLAPNVEGETINLGTGRAATVGEVAEMILGLMGSSKGIKLDESRIRPMGSEVMKLVSDNRKAGRLLDWSPRVSLEEGLRHTIRSVSERIAHYQPSRYAI